MYINSISPFWTEIELMYITHKQYHDIAIGQLCSEKGLYHNLLNSIDNHLYSGKIKILFSIFRNIFYLYPFSDKLVTLMQILLEI